MRELRRSLRAPAVSTTRRLAPAGREQEAFQVLSVSGYLIGRDLRDSRCEAYALGPGTGLLGFI